MATVTHPLEPLAAAEVRWAVAILADAGKVGPTTRFISVALKEPPKAVVHAFTGTEVVPREAFAVLFDNATNACHEAVVSLAGKAVTGWKHVPGVQPTMTADEMAECEAAVLASPEFRAALKRHHGIDDTALVMVDIWSAGNYGEPEEAARRLARPLCFVRSDPTDNGYARPIEGIRPVVDLNTMTVIRVEEHDHRPLPPQAGNYAAARVPEKRVGIKPLDITQPEGPSFEVVGNQVTWQNWKFVIGFNAREGLTLHHLRYADGGRIEGISFEGSGCAISQASASLMTTQLKGKTPAEAEETYKRFSNIVKTGQAPEDFDELAAFAGVHTFPARIKCATLAWHAALEALKQPETTP